MRNFTREPSIASLSACLPFAIPFLTIYLADVRFAIDASVRALKAQKKIIEEVFISIVRSQFHSNTFYLLFQLVSEMKNLASFIRNYKIQ